jgi:hypothetical protein
MNQDSHQTFITMEIHLSARLKGTFLLFPNDSDLQKEHSEPLDLLRWYIPHLKPFIP